MTNVLPFRTPEPKTVARCPVVVSYLAPDVTEGSYVVVSWDTKMKEEPEVFVSQYWGPTGRDTHGRFVKEGSPEEMYLIDHFKYRPTDGSIKILGRIAHCEQDPDIIIPG